MARLCPEQKRKVVYLDCLECEKTACQKDRSKEVHSRRTKKKS